MVVMRKLSGEVDDMKSNNQTGIRKSGEDKDKIAARLARLGSCVGFSLIEILIAMGILSIGILGVASLTGTAMKSTSYAHGLTQATNVAQNRVEALLGVAYANLEFTGAERADLARACAGPAGTVARPVYTCTPTNPLVIGSGAGDTKSYVWRYIVTLIDLNDDGTADSSDGLKRIDVTVDWTDILARGSTRTVEVTTMRSR